AILDEDLVGVVPGNDYPGDEYAWYRCLERVGVVLGNARRLTDGHPAISQQIETRRETSHDVDAIGFEARFTVYGGEDDFRRNDCADATIPPRGDLTLLYPIGEIGQHPRLDLLVECRTEVNERYTRTRSPQ